MADSKRLKKMLASGREQIENWFQSGETIRFKTRSRFHRISVVEKAGRRMLKFNNMTQTAVDIEDGCFSYFQYVNYLHLPMAIKLDPARVLIIGLGGGALPRRMWRDYPELAVHVVEIDSVVVEIARSYFDLPQDPRLSVIVADGRSYLSTTDLVYDQIIIDAFSADSIPADLITDGFMRSVKAHLSPDGVMAINVIGAIRGFNNGMFNTVEKTITRIWDQVYTFPIGIHKTSDPDRMRNIILLATDQKIDGETFAARVQGRVDGRVSVPGYEGFYRDLYK